MHDPETTLEISDATEMYLSRLKRAITANAGRLLKSQWGVAGSVEITFSSFAVGDSIIELEIDNFGNGSLRGPVSVIAAIENSLTSTDSAWSAS